ncbi:MAG: hypothetical protein LBQ49_00785 [Rickettsiales bacterium]|nr:hypothetical protein [Rickettsiales bacterium]
MNNGKGTGIGTGAGLNDYCMIPKNAFTYSNSAWTWNTERDAWHSARKPTTKTNYDWVPTPNDPIMGKGTGENDTLFNLWKKIHYEGCGDTYCEDLDTCKRIHAIGGESTLRWFMYGTTCTGASEKKSETSYYCKVKANGQCSQTKCETDVKPVDFFKISGSNPHQNVVDGNVHTASLNPCMPPLIKGSDGKPDMEASIAEWEAQAILYSDENGTTAASTWLLQKIWEEVWENACMEDWTNDPTPYYKMNDVPSYKG